MADERYLKNVRDMELKYTLNKLNAEVSNYISNIKNVENIGQYNEHGNTLLMDAVIHLSICDSAEIAEKDLLKKKKELFKFFYLLLKNKVNIKEAHREGVTPLMVAIEQKHQDLAFILMKCGADINDPRLLDKYKDDPIIKNLRHAYGSPTEVSLIDRLNIKFLELAEKLPKLAGEVLRFGGITSAIQIGLGSGILAIHGFWNPDLDITPVFFHHLLNVINSIPVNFLNNKIYQCKLSVTMQILYEAGDGVFPENSALKTPYKRLIGNLPTILLIQQVISLAFQLYYTDYQTNPGADDPYQANQTMGVKLLEQCCSLSLENQSLSQEHPLLNELSNLPSWINPFHYPSR